MLHLRRLHWGCDTVTPAGWINSDIKTGSGIDLSCNILSGLPLEDESIEYIASQHALQELRIADQLPALRELRRVLKPRDSAPGPRRPGPGDRRLSQRPPGVFSGGRLGDP